MMMKVEEKEKKPTHLPLRNSIPCQHLPAPECCCRALPLLSVLPHFGSGRILEGGGVVGGSGCGRGCGCGSGGWSY